MGLKPLEDGVGFDLREVRNNSPESAVVTVHRVKRVDVFGKQIALNAEAAVDRLDTSRPQPAADDLAGALAEQILPTVIVGLGDQRGGDVVALD
jgi:hypothetical protein